MLTKRTNFCNETIHVVKVIPVLACKLNLETIAVNKIVLIPNGKQYLKTPKMELVSYIKYNCSMHYAQSGTT